MSRVFRNDILLLLLLILLGGGLRFWQLDSIPPGMTHDEASIGFFVRQVAENTGFDIDTPYGYANELSWHPGLCRGQHAG